MRQYGIAPASADASFRRYFRVTRAGQASLIVMDAPPGKEDVTPYLRVAAMLQEIGVRYAIDFVQRFGLRKETMYPNLSVALGTGTVTPLELTRAYAVFANGGHLIDPYFIERKLYPNVDFYSGIVLRALGIPTNMFTVIFALARTIGWVSQWNEMVADVEQKIGRPRQLYRGAERRDFVPMNQR